MIWHKETLAQDTVRKLSKTLAIDILLSSIFARRGHTDGEELLYFLEKNERYLHNPFLLSEMKEAVERVLMAIDSGEQILIFGDRDVDGVSATTILYHGLLTIGVARDNLQFRNPTATDAYGLTVEVVEAAASQKITLIVTADCGCANHTEIAAAHEHSIDVVVLDHHTPKEERPAAYALVNPHGLNDAGNPYPFRDICATSVAGKFLWALAYMKELGESEGNNQCSCLLDIDIVAGKTIARAAKLQNLCVQSNLEIELQTEDAAKHLLGYIQNEILCSFTPNETRAALANIYGASCDIYLFDLRRELWQQFPSLAERLDKLGALQNAGLLRRELLRSSRLALYRKFDFFDSQIELLISMSQQKMKLPHKVLAQSLDLMAVASIADMMPLHNENRIIVALGLKNISSQPRPGMRELLLELGMLGQDLSAKELSWRVIPVLNSAGRMGNTALVTGLLTAPSSEERRVFAQQLLLLNKERRDQSEKFFALAQDPARQSFAASQGQLLYVAIPELSRGITGLIASRLSQQYGGVPTAVLAQDQTGNWSGSLRSSGEPSVLALLDPLAESFNNYGGHQAAGGFSIDAEGQKTLWSALLELLPAPRPSDPNSAGQSTTATPNLLDAKYKIDAEIPLEMLKPDLLERLWAPLAPYGMQWPELLLLSRGLLLEEAQPIGRSDAGHLRLILRVPANDLAHKQTAGAKGFNAVFWRSAERYAKDFTKGDIVDILYHIQANYYQGQMKFQLQIVDIQARAT